MSRSDAARPNRSSRCSTILAFASDAFLEHGYSGASIADISERLGKSKGWIYSYYPSKEALFLAVIRAAAEQAAESYGPPPDESVDLETALRTVGERYLKTMLRSRSIALYRCIISEAERFPEIGELFYIQLRSLFVAPLEPRLKRHLDSRGVNFIDYLEAGEMFCDLCSSLLHRRALMGVQRNFSKDELQRHIDRAVRIFLELYDDERQPAAESAAASI